MVLRCLDRKNSRYELLEPFLTFKQLINRPEYYRLVQKIFVKVKVVTLPSLRA